LPPHISKQNTFIVQDVVLEYWLTRLTHVFPAFLSVLLFGTNQVTAANELSKADILSAKQWYPLGTSDLPFSNMTPQMDVMVPRLLQADFEALCGKSPGCEQGSQEMMARQRAWRSQQPTMEDQTESLPLRIKSIQDKLALQRAPKILPPMSLPLPPSAQTWRPRVCLCQEYPDGERELELSPRPFLSPSAINIERIP
jgi:hypothetical protein